jgi:hypothetical protein
MNTATEIAKQANTKLAYQLIFLTTFSLHDFRFHAAIAIKTKLNKIFYLILYL